MTEQLRIKLPAALLAAALLLGGCEGGTGGGKDVATAGGKAKSTATPAKEDAAGKMRKFAACMREQGIDMPDPKVAEEGADQGGVTFELPDGSGGGGPDPAKVEAAHKKCQGLLPDGGDLPKPDAATVEKQRQLAKCLRENGVPNFPDPDDNGMTKLGPESGFDPGNPAFAEAQKKCSQFAPPGPGPASAPGIGAVGG